MMLIVNTYNVHYLFFYYRFGNIRSKLLHIIAICADSSSRHSAPV